MFQPPSGNRQTPPSFGDIRFLQRAAGNRAVASVLAAATLPVQRCGPDSDCDCPPEKRAQEKTRQLGEPGGDDNRDDEPSESSAQRIVDCQSAEPHPDEGPKPLQRIDSGPGGVEEGSGHDLRAARFAGQPLLESTFDDRARVRAGSDPDAVTRIQQALVDVEARTGQHYALGTSGPAGNGVDGVFGPITNAAVRKFKTDEALGSTEFGDVGPGTMGRLDTLFAGGGGGGGTASCADGPVSLEPDPIPDVPAPKVTFLPAPELLALVRKRQTPGAFIPSRPPLGATVPKVENVLPVSVRSVPAGAGCVRCVAEWPLPVPSIEVFVATGSFTDEKRFWVTQPGDNGECPTPVPTLKPVQKVILPSALPKILAAELEHVADFRRAYRLAIHRWSANVGRLGPTRSHLRAPTETQCLDKVTAFLNQQSGLPVGLPLSFLPTEIFVGDAMHLHSPSSKRDVAEHIAISGPPADRPPIRPTTDINRNPFGCSAFLRRFDGGCLPAVPGPSSEQTILDTDSPPRKPWHSL